MITREELKFKFKRGHKITQQEYQDWLDATHFKQDLIESSTSSYSASAGIALFANYAASAGAIEWINVLNNPHDVIDKTFDELKTMIDNNQLGLGRKYRITNYRPSYTIPNTFPSGPNGGESSETLNLNFEPLIVMSASVSSIYHQAYSETHPEDIIYYTMNNKLLYSYYFDENTDNPYDTNCLYGLIYFRHDTKKNVSMGEDFRNIKYIRWGDSITSDDVTPKYYNVFTYDDLDSYESLDINNINIQPNIFPDAVLSTEFRFRLSNSIFVGFDIHNNTIGYNFYNNTIKDRFRDNKIGSWCSDNIIKYGFSDNHIGNGFYRNEIGLNFNNNKIGNNATNNIIQQECSNNVIENGFHNNEINDSFFNNTIGSEFYGNSVGINFNNNKIGIISYGNSIQYNFTHNTIGNGFISNTIENDFIKNTVNHNFNFNVIRSFFTKNVIGLNAFNNDIGTNASLNIFPDDFSSNIVGTGFNNNKIFDVGTALTYDDNVTGLVVLSHAQNHSVSGNDPLTASDIGAVDLSSLGVSGGVPTLDVNGLIPRSQLPEISITDVYVVTNLVDLYSLTAETGDVGIVTNDNESYILKGTNPSVSGDWQKLLTPPDLVKSVNGKTGIVTINLQDVYTGSVSGTIKLDGSKSLKVTDNNDVNLFEINNDGTTSINSLSVSAVTIDCGTY